MKKTLFLILLITVFHFSGYAQTIAHQEYSKEVGEIAYDEIIDDPAFKEPDTIRFFTKPRYKEEKPAIISHFKEKYSSKGYENVSGYVTIRFFVNSAGKAGKFRMQAMDFQYQPKILNEGLTGQILALTKEFNGWKPFLYNDKAYGYYAYLNFRIIKGEIKEITP